MTVGELSKQKNQAKNLPSKKNDSCRYCGSKRLTKYLSLGEHPPSNSFISEEMIPQEIKYPLEVYFCNDCFLSQLVDVVPAEIIFDDYIYLSSSSKVLRTHYAELVEMVSKRFQLQDDDTVVDIGCNDGVLLKGYTSSAVKKVGVEPSKVAEIAEKEGFNVVKDFFGPDTAQRIVKDFGKAKIITATNVFVHIDNMHQFVKGVRDLIHDEGVFIIEASYLMNVIDELLFDTIYHEHLCYLSLTPLISFLEKQDLEVFDVERLAIGASGPALRVYMQRKNGPQNIEDSVRNLLQQEKKWGIGDINHYLKYAQRVEKIKSDVLKFIDLKKSGGFSIGAYGAPAKGNTLLNYFEIDTRRISYAADTNPMKQGLVTPGSHIPIISEEDFIKKMPTYALLLSWNYLDFFLEKSDYIKKGGRFIVPLPKPVIKP